MKASDYFEKYKTSINTKEGAAELFIEISKEVEEIAQKRHATSDDAARAIVKELNQKWNALARLFEKNLGQSYIIRDGFINLWRLQIKGL
jgi:hypothetical protein